MRLVMDILIALMFAGILTGVALYYNQQYYEIRQYEAAQQALAVLHEQVRVRGTLRQVPTNRMGFPLSVSPLWFHDDLPINVLAPTSYPWLDVAPVGDPSDHPPDPVLVKRAQAGIWYNPNRGVFRARVPRQFTEQQTLSLYNRLNSTAISALPRQVEIDDARQPLSLASLAGATVAKPNKQPVRSLRDSPPRRPSLNNAPSRR